MWGFVHSILVTVPVTVIDFSWSNSAANAWCASTGATDTVKRPAVKIASFIFIAVSPSGISSQLLLHKSYASALNYWALNPLGPDPGEFTLLKAYLDANRISGDQGTTAETRPK